MKQRQGDVLLLALALVLLCGCGEADTYHGRPAVFAYYDPTIREPERWESKNLLIMIAVTDLHTQYEIPRKVNKQLRETINRGLFHWPIKLSDGTKAWSLKDLDQVWVE